MKMSRIQTSVFPFLLILLARIASAQAPLTADGLAAFSTGAASGGNSPTPGIETSGLVFYLPLDDGGTTATDVVAGLVAPVNFVFNGAVTAPTTEQDQWGLGVVGKSSLWMPATTAMAGTNGPVFFADEPQFNFGTGDFTIECWMASDQLNQGGVNVGVGKVNAAASAGTDQYFLGLDNSGVEFSVGTIGSTATTITGGSDPLDGGFHFLAGVRQGNEILGYLDGVLVASNSFTGTVNPTGSQLAIGGYGDYSIVSPAFNQIGNLDDVAIYDRALSPADLLTNMSIANFRNNPNLAANCYLLQPMQHTNTQKLAVFFHGAGFDGNSMMFGYNFQNVTAGLLGAGYALLSVSSPANDWGSAAGVAAYTNALGWARSYLNYTNAYGIPGSMGALDALQIAANYPAYDLNHVYLFCGVTSISNLFYHPGSGEDYSNAIYTAWGLTAPSQLATVTAGLDPLTIATNHFVNVTIRAIGSLSDTFVPFLTAGGSALTNGVTWATATNSTGNHFDVSNFNFPDVTNSFGP